MKLRRTIAPLALLFAAGTAAAGVQLEIGIGTGWGWGWGPPGYYGGYGAYGPWWGGAWRWAPPPVVVVPAPAPRRHRPEPAPRSVGPTLPDPVITARNGQDPNQAEYDRQRCNRWAVTQPAALADAAEFQRTVAACLDGLGYTMK